MSMKLLPKETLNLWFNDKKRGGQRYFLFVDDDSQDHHASVCQTLAIWEETSRPQYRF